MTPIEHGSAYTYRRYACRCEACREATSQGVTKRRRNRYAARQLVGGRLIAPLPDERHGQLHTYIYHGCRCARCTRANTTYQSRNKRGAA